jgi:hypothetical protein
MEREHDILVEFAFSCDGPFFDVSAIAGRLFAQRPEQPP